ncbi:MAG: AAA family ATPase [Rhodoferax sp.]
MGADSEPFDCPLHATVRTALADTPVVCLLGPRQAGKTTLARQFEPEYGYISCDDPATLAFAESDPAGFVAALPDPVILEEVQRVPELLRAIKLAVDQVGRPGRLLLAGSANLLLLPWFSCALPAVAEAVGQCGAASPREVQAHPIFVHLAAANSRRAQLRLRSPPEY